MSKPIRTILDGKYEAERAVAILGSILIRHGTGQASAFGKLDESDIKEIYNRGYGEENKAYQQLFCDIYVRGLIKDEIVLEAAVSMFDGNETVETWKNSHEQDIDQAKQRKAIIDLSSKDETTRNSAAQIISLSETYTENASLDTVVNRINCAKPDELNKKDTKELSLLHKACYSGQIDIARALIDRGADCFTADTMGRNPLCMLAYSPNKTSATIIFDILANKIKLSETEDIANYKTYVMIALKNGNVPLANKFMEYVPEKDVEKIKTAIITSAIKSNDDDLAENFFNLEKCKGINSLQVANPEGAVYEIPLLESALFAKTEVFSKIVSKVNPDEIHYDTLEKAVLVGKPEAVKSILKHNDGILSTKTSYNTTKYKNLVNIAFEEIKSIEEKNLAKDITDKQIDENKKLVADIYASLKVVLTHNIDKENTIESLDINTAFKVDLDVDKKPGYAESAIDFVNSSIYGTKVKATHKKDNVLTAAYSNIVKSRINGQANKTQEDFLYNILNHPKADLNIPNEKGQNLLMLASQYGDRDVAGVAILRGKALEIDNNAWQEVINAKDHDGNSALFYAAESADPDLSDMLIDEGAIFTTKTGNLSVNRHGTNLLMAACEGGNPNIINSIKQKCSKTDFKHVDRSGNNALHYLAIGSKNNERRSEIAEELLDNGLNIDSPNKKGRTPLMSAVLNNNISMVKDLLNKGANINSKDSQGNTALIYACLLNNKDMIETVMSANNLDVNLTNKKGVSAFLIAAQRDGLEPLSDDVLLPMKAKLDQELKDEQKGRIEKIKKNKVPITDINTEEANKCVDLTSKLINKGANPYVSKPVKLVDEALAVSAIIASNSVVSKSSHLIGGIPIWGKLASRASKMLSAATVGLLIQSRIKRVKGALCTYLTRDTYLDKRVSLSNDDLMIGSINNKGLGFIKHGNSLKSELANHNNFKAVDGAIFNNTDLADKLNNVNKNSKWISKAHDILTDKYLSLEKQINHQPWYNKFPLIWKSIGLQNAKREILEAHALIKDSGKADFLTVSEKKDNEIKRYSFEERFGNKDGLIEVIKSPKLSKQLIASMISGKDPKAKQISELVENVIERKICVAPDTYYQFSQFASTLKLANNCEKNRQIFTKKNMVLTNIPLIDGSDAFMKNTTTNYIKDNTDQKIRANTNVPAVILGAVQYCLNDKTKTSYQTRNEIAGYVAETAGVVGGAYVASKINSDFRNGIGRLSQAASSVAVGTANFGTIAASTIITSAPTIAAAAIAAGVVTAAYSYRDNLYQMWSYLTTPSKSTEIKNVSDAKNIDDTKKAFDKLKPNIQETKIIGKHEAKLLRNKSASLGRDSVAI